MNPYLKFWQIDRPLFTRIEPVPALYLPQRLLAPLERLALTCGQDAALALLTGEVGTGKTTLLRWLSQRLPPVDYDVMTTTILQREPRSNWLFPRLAEHLGVRKASNKDTQDSLIRPVVSRLDEYIEAGRKLVILIDAAHLIDYDVGLDEIAALFSLQSLGGGCVVCVLAGNEQLSQNLQNAPELAARNAYELRLTRLSSDETSAYLECRTRSAGAHIVFEQAAIDLLHASSRGVIASLNIYAEGCLIAAYQAGSHKITEATAKAAISFRDTPLPQAEIERQDQPPPPPEKIQPAGPQPSLASQNQKPDPSDRPPQHSINLTSLFKR